MGGYCIVGIVRRSAASIAAALAVAVAPATRPAAGREAPFLLTLPGRATSVRYTPGSLDRAARLQDRLERLARAFADAGPSQVGLTAHVLEREDFEAAGGGRSYGLPAIVGPGVVALPAHGDAGTVALWRSALGAAPSAAPGQPLVGSPEEAASLGLCDWVAEAEAAAALLALAGLRFDEPWVAGLAAHTIARAAFARWEAGRLPEIEGVFGRLAGLAPGGGAAPAVADAGWLALQGQLFEGARRLAGPDPRRAARRLLRLAAKADGTLTAARVRQAFPALEPWVARLAPGGPPR